MKRLFVFITLYAVAFASCQYQSKDEFTPSPNERMMMATLYQQMAAENDALYLQAYNIATIMIYDELNKTVNKKRAIITDIDETVLDNSPYQAKCILEGISYPEKWDEWCRLAQAEALPGSQKFLNFVVSKDIEVFYVTNRKEHFKAATIENLKRRGFPNADKDHLFMRTSSNSKESRRNRIEEDYRVVMLLGDNLEDFSKVFEGKVPEARKEMVDKLESSFGRRFIAFPNPMYGSWENAIYNYRPDTTAGAKAAMRIKALESF
jgi:5'-nucleotidase (lipoprotein e(P4) family)